ncbi:MAG: tyrosine-type recombinase/integrase [Myxococcales bacterium]|nr:tyrosine-type recombinase/integrase [Myxococcales bacterium]
MAAYVDRITRAPRTFTEREQLLLLRATGEHRSGFRDHVIIATALATGLRAHELLALDVGDVFDAAGRSRRRVQLRIFKRSHDDPAAQEVILADGLRAKLDKLYRWKRAEGQSLTADAPVFVSRNGNRLSGRQLRERFALWQTRAGIERPLSFHGLRHSSCTNLYRATKDLRLVQRFARHASITSTMRYAHPADEDLVRAVQGLPC